MTKSGSWGKSSVSCTGAVDIYAIGLVAIEMFSDFNTRIERMLILENAKSDMKSIRNHRGGMGDFEESTIWRFPVLAGLVGRMLDRNARNRPNARKLLEELRQLSPEILNKSLPVIVDSKTPSLNNHDHKNFTNFKSI